MPNRNSRAGDPTNRAMVGSMDTIPRSTRTIGAFNTWAAQHLGERAAQEGTSTPPPYLTPDERREWRAGFYGLTEATVTAAPARPESLLARILRKISL